MKVTVFLILILSASGLIDCGQIGNHTHKEMENINYDEITNAVVKHAIETWQKGDS
tara:strand:- start:2277 stop:2444 length:168 start_codon:yes stop_codon:yes gene_type:complete